MICILVTLFVMALIILLAYLFNCRQDNVVGCIVLAVIIGIAFIATPMTGSYWSYLDIKADYYGVIAQYEGAINIYENKAIINVAKISLTDFKYQGYQKEMASLIRDLRYKIEKYNALYIKKKTMKENIMFSWLITAPDSGMKLLQMNQENLTTEEE